MENFELTDEMRAYFNRMKEVSDLKAKFTYDNIRETMNKAYKKQELIDELDYERKLIVEDALKQVREELNNSSYSIFPFTNSDIFYKAWKYFNYKKSGKLSEIEKAYEEHPMDGYSLKDYKNDFGYAYRTIKGYLIPEKYEKAELIKIYDCSYSSSYEFYFRINNIDFIIEIPVFMNVTQDNYADIIAGYKLRQEEGCSISLEFSEINPAVFKDKLDKWLDDKVGKSNE